MYCDCRLRRGCLFVLVLGVFVPCALADFAVCQAGWEWASNSKKLNPCEIAGALEATCQGFAAYVLGPLGQGENYITPQKNSTAQKCECNTVMFSLYMACTACQNVSLETWSFWEQYCDEVYVTQYPESIPLETAVPNWAYLNYTEGDNFDPVAARAAGSQPERLTPVPSTVSLPESSTGSGSLSSSSMSPNSVRSVSTGGGQQNNDQTMASVPSAISLPANSTRSGSQSSTTVLSAGVGQQDNSQTEKSSPNVGAIVGSVIGGLAFLAAVGVGAWIFRRRKAPGEEIGRDDLQVDDARHSSVISTYENDMPQPPEMRFHDPSDPLTSPDRIYYGRNGEFMPNRLGYTGAAEV